jgi:hypothetical protein
VLGGISLTLIIEKMYGGFNKILRNIVAGASDTEFEKVSLAI